MSIKKTLVLVTLLVLAAGFSFAQTTGTINLAGTVPAILEVSVVEAGGAGSLDLSIDASNVLVGTVTERSNKKAGYTVSLESSNGVAAAVDGAQFESADPANTDVLSYSMTYGGAAVSLVSGVATVSDVNTKTTAAGTVNEVRITYAGATEFLLEDAYADTITMTIAAK